MALPTYRQVLDDPAFADADVQTQKSINDAYWKAHEAENPGDKWGAEMYDASTKSIEIKNEIADASPIEQRNLNLQRDALNTRISLGVNLKEGAFKTTKEFTDAAASENLRLASERSKVVKTLSLNDPTVDAQMQPAWQALGKSALDEGIFDQKTLSPTAKPGRYAELKTELSTTFHLSPEEVDDVVKHRMGLQTDPVSRDAFGQVHIKPEVLAKPAAEIQKAIEASNLPTSIKKREAGLIPDKIEGFKSGFVDNVMKNQPEVAAYVGMSPDMTAEQNFGLLTDRLIQNFGYQGATGAVSGLQGTLADVAHGVGLFQEKFTGGEVPSMEKVSRDIESRSKINQQLTDLSYALNKEATTLWGTNAAVIGGGIESVVESAALGAITAPLAPQFALAKLAGSGKLGKFLVDGVNSISKSAPSVGVFGARQGVQTYEQAKKAGMPEEDAIKFGIQSGAIETFTTMLFSGINLGGVEDIATGAARQRVAAEVVNKIRSTPWAFSKGIFKNVTGEVLEEDAITSLDSVFTQAKLNPNMTWGDFKQALYDTTVATLAASGAFAIKEGYDQGSAVAEANRKISTAQQTDQQLEETADAIRLENLAKENLPEAQAEGGTVAPPSPERVAELQSQRATILADLKKVPIKGPAHDKLQDELDSVEGELSDVQNIPTPTGESNAPEALQLPPVPTGEAAQPNLEPTGGTQKGTGVAETKVEGEIISPKKEVPTESLPAGAPPLKEGGVSAVAQKMDEEVIKTIDTADATLPEKAQDAVSRFTGFSVNAKENPDAFGIMDTGGIDKALDGRDPEVAAELENAFAPIREKLRKQFGDTVTLFRAQDKNAGDVENNKRQALSWTSNPDVAGSFAGVSKVKDNFSEEEIQKAEKTLEETGRFEIRKGYWLEKKTDPTYGDYIAIMDTDVGGEVTDTPSVRDFLEELNQDRTASRKTNAKKAEQIRKEEIPLSDVVWVTNRGGQMEFIVRTSPQRPLDFAPTTPTPTPILPEGLSPEDAEFVAEKQVAETVRRRAENENAGSAGKKLNAIETKWEKEGVRVVLRPLKDNVELTIIYVPKLKQGKGVGSKVLKDIKAFSDETGVPITLLASDIDQTGNIPKDFYSKNGFVNTKGDSFEYRPTPRTLTPEATTLLESVAKGGVPMSVNTRLERIAAENGIEVTGSTKPQDIIDALKSKAAKQNENQVQETSGTPPIKGVTPVAKTEGEAEAGTAQREGQGQEVNVPVIDPKNLRGVTNVMLDVLGFTTEEAAGITGETLKQEGEGEVVEVEGFHGTTRKFAKFDLARSGQNFAVGGASAAFFTSAGKLARAYADNISKYRTSGKPRVVGAKLSLTRPLKVTTTEDQSAVYFDKNKENLLQELKNGGHKSIIITGPNDTTYVVFDDSSIGKLTDTLYQGPNAQVTFSGLASALITYYKNANGSSAVHEPIHIARRFLLNRNIPADKRAGITDGMIDAANAFVGATDSNWTVAQEEKFARAFERYLWEGVETGVPKVDSLFKQITNFMRDVYKNIKGSSLDVEMTPEVRQLFDKLITRGETLKAAGIAPTSIKVGVKVKKGKPQAKAATPEQLGIRKALLKSQAEAFGVAAPSRRVSMSDQEAIDIAESRLANPEARTGTKLVEHLLSDPTQTTDKVQHALLAHEMVVRSNQVDKVRQFSKRPDLTTQERVNNAAELRDAYDKLEEILDVIRFQGSKAGLALQAMKLVTNRKFELEQMLGDAQVWANDGSTTRVQLTDEQRQLVQDMHDKIKDLQKENDDLRAEAEQRIKELEKASVVAAQARDVKQKKVVKETERVRILDEKLAPETALSRLKARGNLFGGTLKQEGEADAEYLALAKDPEKNRSKLQAMVDAAAKVAGYDDAFIRGDSDASFTVFDPNYAGANTGTVGARIGFFFTGVNRTLAAAGYTSLGYRGGAGANMAGVRKFFVKRIKPFQIAAEHQDRQAELGNVLIRELFPIQSKELTLPAPEGMNAADLGRPRPNHEMIKKLGTDARKWLLDRGFDSIKYVNEDSANVRETIILKPENIKSSDPVTRDKNGNVIPLSQRFNPESPSILFQSPEGLSPEVLDDLSIVGASFILHGDNTEAKFTEALVKEFGEDARPYGGEIFERSKVKLDKVRKIAKVPKSPQELKAEIDPNKELSGRMILNMVGGYLQEGIPEEKVLARVHKELQDVWKNLTFDEVSDAYTGYGKAKYPSSEELAVSLRHVRNIERIKRQIRVVEGGQAPKKSGVQRDKASERILELNKELAAAFKASGIVDTETNQLTSALGAIKTRFKNQIVEYTKAVKTLTRLPSNKRGVDYDAEATKLKAELDALRAEYTKIFENKTLTEKQKIERAATTLDRLIAEEEDMLAKGILSKPRTAKTVFTDPDIVARQERLKKLRTVRKAAIRALNPTKSKAQLAYEAALRENKKGLARDRQTVATGILPISKRNVKTFTTTQELKDILNERETLKEIIKLHRGQKRRAESVSKAEEMRNQRAVEAAEKSLELINKRIEDLVSGTTPAATTKTVRPVNLAVTLARALRDSRRRTMQALEQYREGKRVDTLKKLEEFYADKIRRKDFRKEVKPPALLTKKISDAQFRADQAKAEWLKSRAAFMLEGAPWYKKAFRLSRGLLQLRKIISLGGDIGAVLRQVGVVTYRNVFHPVVMTRMFARALKAGFSLSEKAEYEIYQAISTAPEAMAYKQMGMVFHSPFDEAYGNKEDIPDPEFLNIIRNAPAWKSLFIGKGLAQVLSAAERFQRAYINQGRYEFMKALVTSAGGVEHLTPQKMALIGNAVMVGTGRWSGNRGNKFEKILEQAIPLLNSTIFISARYSLSRLAVASGEPVWSLKGGSPTENLALRRKIALEIYGKSVIGRAVMITLTKMAYDAATGDDDDEERWRGVFNPRDKNNFMKVKVGKTRIDMSSGIGPYLSELKLVVDAVNGNAVKVNRDTGEVTSMKSREIGDELINFQLNRSNINAAYILRTFLTKEYYGGKPVTLENAVKELILPIMINDTEKLHAEHGKEGIAIWAQMMLGDGVQPPSNYKKKASSDYSFKY